MLASHSALWGSTGRSAMGVFQTLSAGKMGQLGAPGSGVPAEATAGPPTAVRPSHSMAVATNATAHLIIRRLTGIPFPGSTVPHGGWPAGGRRPTWRSGGDPWGALVPRELPAGI